MNFCKIVLVLSALVPILATAAERPNILFIFSDDHATAAISAYGSRLAEVAPTPNIDRLADEGALIENSFCCNSICGPSRAAILTGMHSHRNGFVDNNNSVFDGNQTTFPALMRDVGYQTALIGKWHLRSLPKGFDFWEILPGQGRYYNPDLKQMPDGKSQKFSGHCTDVVTEHALDWLKNKRDKKKPFVLMCQHKAPHRSWSPALRHLSLFDGVNIPEPDTLFDDYANRSSTLKETEMTLSKNFEWSYDMKLQGENLLPDQFSSEEGQCRDYLRMSPEQKKAWDAHFDPLNQQFIDQVKAGKMTEKDVMHWKYQRYLKNYLSCIKGVDESVGQLLDYLDEAGLAENTIVIYSSDQGFYLGEHGWYDKRWMFEESLEMPFLIRWPGVVKPGSRPKAMIQNIDYAPTFLTVAGAEIPKRMQGQSIIPVLKGEVANPEDFREAIYYYYTGEATHNVPAHDGVRTERYKLMRFPNTNEWNLFDLEKDPQEMVSLHNDPEYSKVLAEMKQLYDDTKTKYLANESTIPAHRMNQKWWKERHLQKVKQAKDEGEECQLVFVGDSITHSWENGGKAIYEKNFSKFKPLNLGFSGDQTSHVLWRIKNDEWPESVKPKVAVVMIGTNNTGHGKGHPAVETAQGIKLIIEDIHDRSPDTQIILHPIFPRGATPADPKRKLNDEINTIIADLGNLDYVHIVDLAPKFLDEDGNLPKTIMPDLLHPKAEGYQIWADALMPKLKELGLE